MSKVLVIKGADFSENKVSELGVLAINRENFFDDACANVNKNYSPAADIDYASLQNKKIIAVKIKPSAAGVISILKSAALDSGGYEVVETININTEDVGKIKKYPLDINVGENDIISIIAPTDTGNIYMKNAISSSLSLGLVCRVGSSNVISFSDSVLAINWYIE